MKCMPQWAKKVGSYLVKLSFYSLKMIAIYWVSLFAFLFIVFSSGGDWIDAIYYTFILGIVAPAVIAILGFYIIPPLGILYEFYLRYKEKRTARKTTQHSEKGKSE